MEYFIGLYKMFSGFEDKLVIVMCILVYSLGEKDFEVKLFCGKIFGEIVAFRGFNDFGWDLCF